ncbi:MAG: dihydrodipicolinate synthase family protein [Pseudoxanthomonas suwonensis]|nr:MAG: dihydrodipicolinate synthase family protein [Pseudoxanthomonas suwonensis]
MKQIGGVLVALSTPFDADGAIDEKRLREHVEFVLEGGVHGVVPCGSTGEFVNMTVDERKRVVEIVVDQVAGRVPVAPGTGALTTPEAIELTRHAQEVGADSALIVAPFYETPTRDDVIEYYGAIGDAVDMPLIAYNLPAVTGIDLDLEFYRDLAQRSDKYRFVKDTSGNMEQAMSLIYNLKGELGVMVGLDTIILPAFAMGAIGTIWGAPNWAPRECVQLWEDVQAGNVAKAVEDYGRMWNALDFIDREGYAVGTKTACRLMGQDLGATRAPYRPFSAEKEAELDRLLEPVRAARG